MNILQTIEIQNPESQNSTLFLSEMYKKWDMHYPKFHKMDILAKLGILSMEMLVQKATLSPEKTGLILSSHQGCWQTDVDFIETIQTEHFYPSPTLFVYTLPNIVMGEICIKYGLKGQNMFLMLEYWDEKQLLSMSKWMIERLAMEQVIIGWLNADKQSCHSFFSWVKR